MLTLPEYFVNRFTVSIGEREPKYLGIGGSLIDNGLALDANTRADIRPPSDQGGLRPDIGVVSMRAVAKFVVTIICAADPRPLPIVGERGVAVGFDDKRKFAGQAFFAHYFFCGIDTGESIKAIIAHLLQYGIHTFSISWIFKVNLCRHAHGFCDGCVIGYLPILTDG